MSCTIPNIENRYRQSNPELADKLNQQTFDTWNTLLDSKLFEEKDNELYVNKEGTKKRVKQNELIDSINNPTFDLEKSIIDGFLKDFNVSVNEYQDLKKELNLNAVSASDLISKTIAYEKGNSILPEVAYFAYKILGKSNDKVRRDLRYLVNKWDKYKDRFEFHKNVVNKEQGFIENKQEWKQKIRDLVIFDFLQESLIEYYKNPKQFEKILDKKLTKDDFKDSNDLSLWESIIQHIQDLLSLFRDTNKDKVDKLQNIGYNIANEILNKDYNLFNYDLNEEAVIKTYEDSIKTDGFAEELVNFGTKYLKIVLTGSLALRKAGKVYRTLSETFHDIDWVIPFEKTKTEDTEVFNSIQNLISKIGKEDDIEKKINKELEKTQWYKAFSSKYSNFKIINGFFGREVVDWGSYTLQTVIDGDFDTNGEWIPGTGYVNDFFVRLNDHQEEHESYFKLWKEIMIAKIKMGRIKDFSDWKAFIPYYKSADKFNFYYKEFVHTQPKDTLQITEDNKVSVDVLRNEPEVQQLDNNFSPAQMSDALKPMYQRLLELNNNNVNKTNQELLFSDRVIFEPAFDNVGLYYLKSEENPTFTALNGSLDNAKQALLKDKEVIDLDNLAEEISDLTKNIDIYDSFEKHNVKVKLKNGVFSYAINNKIEEQFNNIPASVVAYILDNNKYELLKAFKSPIILPKYTNDSNKIKDIITNSTKDLTLDDLSIIKERISNLGLEDYIDFKLVKNGETFDIEYFYEIQTDNRKNIDSLINKLKKLFPQVKVKVIAEDMISMFLDSSSFSQEQWNEIPSFVIGDTVYLIENRYNESEVIEEFLHPFINSLYSSNISLFDSLLNEAMNKYPELLVTVNNNYQSVYSNEDIKKEILTQALQKEYELVEKSNLLDKFLKWIKELINNINDKPISIANLKNITLSELSRLLNNDSAKIFLDSFENKPYYHINDHQKSLYDKIADYQMANSVQKNVLDVILKNQKVSFIEEGHVYQTEDGEIYQSITESFKGKLDDEQDKYAINRSWGNQLDFIAEQILIGKNLQDIDYTQVLPEGKDYYKLPEEVVNKFYDHFSGFIASKRMSGSIIVPQIVLNSEEDKRAGKPDFLEIDLNGEISVLDLKVSKNAIQLEGKKYKATFPDNTEVELSTKQQHTVQTRSYAKILENYGFTVKNVHTIHYLLKVEGEGEDARILPLEKDLYEGVVSHNDLRSEAAKLVEKIITTKTESILESNEGISRKKFESALNLVEKLRILVGNFEINLKTRHQKNPNFADYVTDLSHFVATLENKDNSDEIYRDLLEYYSNRFKVRNDTMANLLTNNKDVTVKDVNTFNFYLQEAMFLKEVLQQNEFLATNTSLKTNILFSQENLDTFFDMYQELTNKHLEQSLTSTLQQEINTKDLLDETIPYDTDINKMSLYVRRMVESGDKLLTFVDTLYKNSLQRIIDYMKSFKEDVIKIGNSVIKNHSGKKGEEFHYMLVKNLKNAVTGYVVEALDYYKYIDVRDKFYSKCYDEKGDLKSFIPITNEMSEKEVELAIKHNKDLYYARKEKRMFDQPEQLVGTSITNGDYHKYSDSYIKARAEVLIPIINQEYGYITWKENENVPLSKRIAFFDKYYTPYIMYLKAVTVKGVPTGEVIETKERFVKREYLDKIANNTNGLLNPNYVEIQSWKDSSNLEEKSKYDFYEFYIKTMKDNLNKIPLDKALLFNGKIPRMKSSITNEATVKLPGTWLGVFSNTVKDFFSFKSEEGSVMVLADNEINDRALPLMYMSDFKSDRTIAFYENQKLLANLLFNKKTEKEIVDFFKTKNVSDNDIKGLLKLNLQVNNFEDYKKLLTKLNNSLAIEKSKITTHELETNLAKSLTEFTKMVYTYDTLSQIEDTIKLVGDKIKSKKYKKESTVLDNLKAKGKKEDAFVKGENSNVYERYQKYLDMVFYKNTSPFNSKIGQIAKKTLSVMSLRSVGLNPFGQFNNYLIGKVSNYIKANPLIGSLSQGLYWNGSHMNRAHKEYLLSTKNLLNKIEQGYLKDTHIKNNKYDAVVDYFNLERGFTPAGSFGQYGTMDKAMQTAYLLQQKIEYALQTQTGISVLLAKELTNKETNEKLSLYDALIFDKSTGKISGLLPGYDFTYEDKLNMTNYIYEINASIHGNYAVEDKMVIQSNLIGELVSVYRKHIIPNIDDRFRKGYYNDVRGWQEGRYVSAYQFFRTWYEFKNIRTTWESLNETQRINMKQNLTELGFFLSTFALYLTMAAFSDGDDDDSKLYNSLRVAVDRLNSDILFYYPILGLKQQAQQIKNPSAVISYVGDIGEILVAASKINKPYYDRGIHKGELRVWKEIKDVVPLLNLSNKWDSYETVKSFYIK